MNTLISNLTSRLRGDRYMWILIALLSLMSLLLVYSSTETLAYKKRGGDTEFYLVWQLGLIIGGWITMYICHLINYSSYGGKFPTVMLVFAVLLLMYTLLSGAVFNRAARWIELPIIKLTFQTSDFAKLALILYVAQGLGKMQAMTEEEADMQFWKIFLPVMLVCALIAPANLSTAAMLFGTCIFLMFIGSKSLKNLWRMFLFGAALMAMLIIVGDAFPQAVRVRTWANRITNFISGGEGDVQLQVEQAKIAIAKGGVFGVGPGNGTQSNFLPHAYSDYIYAVICEEYGLFGAGVVILLYLALLTRCIKMVTRSGSERYFATLLALGLCTSLVLQAFANMAVAVNLIPVTGLTMPLISLGGTSLLFSCISFGIILSVSKSMEA